MDYRIVLLLAILAVSCSCSPYYPGRPDFHKESCACGRIYIPVCGSDGRWYNNKCEFDCQAEYLWQKRGIYLKIDKENHCDDVGSPDHA